MLSTQSGIRNEKRPRVRESRDAVLSGDFGRGSRNVRRAREREISETRWRPVRALRALTAL